MPRKSSFGTKPGPSRTSRASVAFKSTDDHPDLSDPIENDDDDDRVGVNGDDENGMMEMLSMLQEFQKRKASKSSTRSAAFSNRKNALFADARENVDKIVSDGAAYIDQCLATIGELRAQETSQVNHLKDMSLMWQNQEENVQALMETYPTLIDDISHRRAAQINDASAMLEEHLTERQISRRKLILNAKARMDENLEKQKLATDAAALIKHYKALLLS